MDKDVYFKDPWAIVNGKPHIELNKMEYVGWTTLNAKEGILTGKYDSRNMWPKFIEVMIVNLESRPLIKTSPKISPISAQVSSIISYFVCLVGLRAKSQLSLKNFKLFFKPWDQGNYKYWFNLSQLSVLLTNIRN